MTDVSSAAVRSFGRPPLGLVQEGIESALKLASVGVWEHFLPEDQAFYSDGFFHLVGVDPDVGRATPEFWPSRLHPQDRERLRAGYAEFLHKPLKDYEEIYRVRHERGHWITVLARASWVTRSPGESGRVALGFAIDVTARHADYDRLRVREERFRMSLSALHGVVYDMDLRTNQAERHGLQRMLGYETLSGDDGYGGWLSIMHPEDVERVQRIVDAQRISGTDYEMTYRVKHRDGRWRLVKQRGTYTLGPDGRAIRAFGVIEDITEPESQRERLQLQAAIIERMSEGVLVADREGTILFANPALGRMLGYGQGELTGQNSSSLSFRSAAAFDGLLDAIFAGTEGDKTSVIDLEARRKDNTMLPVQCGFSSLVFAGKRCVVAVFNDVTGRKQMEREMMQIATRMQQRIGSDLHEGVGQQLAGIAMMLQGLRQRVNSAAPAMHADVEAVIALVNAAIRDTRQLARGLSPVRPTREGLQEGFQELVNEARDSHGVDLQLEMDLPADLAVDENVVSNLYRIAEEAVLNVARHAGTRNVQLRLRVAGPDVEMLVIDDGSGFDPQAAMQTGTGLRMMRFRMQLVNGYLSVESRPGGGTTVRCRCPAGTDKETT